MCKKRSLKLGVEIPSLRYLFSFLSSIIFHIYSDACINFLVFLRWTRQSKVTTQAQLINVPCMQVATMRLPPSPQFVPRSAPASTLWRKPSRASSALSTKSSTSFLTSSSASPTATPTAPAPPCTGLPRLPRPPPLALPEPFTPSASWRRRSCTRGTRARRSNARWQRGSGCSLGCRRRHIGRRSTTRKLRQRRRKVVGFRHWLLRRR